MRINFSSAIANTISFFFAFTIASPLNLLNAGKMHWVFVK
jgi:hypothetical protein